MVEKKVVAAEANELTLRIDDGFHGDDTLAFDADEPVHEAAHVNLAAAGDDLIGNVLPQLTRAKLRVQESAR